MLRKGVGAEIKHAAIFTQGEEDKLWSSGAIGTHSPQALVHAVFCYLGKSLCLRGGQEQRDLKPSQFRREHDADQYVYVENGSKNHQETFGQKESENKVDTMFKNEKAGQRCPVFYWTSISRSFPALLLRFSIFI